MTLSPGPKVQPKRSTRTSPGGFSSRCSSRFSDRAPSPPRFIGHSTWTSRIGSSPNRAGMRRATTSSSLATPSSGSWQRTRWKSLPGSCARLGHLALVDPVRVGDDPALGRLPEHLGQPDHRHRARGDDVGQHLPRPDRGQLVDVADQDQRRPWRGTALSSACISGTSTIETSSTTSRSHSSGCSSPRLKPPWAGSASSSRCRVLASVPGGLAQPLGGPAGRCRQGDGGRLGRQDLEDAVDQGGLADARPAGDHQQLGAQGQPHRLPLARGQGDPGLALDPGDRRARPRPPARAGGPWPGRSSRSAMPRSARCSPARNTQARPSTVSATTAPSASSSSRAASTTSAGISSSSAASARSSSVGQAAMALVHRLGQRVGDAGPGPDHRRLLDPEPRRDLVGALEADAADVAREPVGVLGDHLDGIGAVGLEDPHRPRGADAMAVQEQHDLADHLLLGPALRDALGALGPDPGDLAQALGALLDRVEHAPRRTPATSLLA